MAKIPNPWDDNDNDSQTGPWDDKPVVKNKPKIKVFKNPQPTEINFQWWWLALAVVGVWLLSGFYSVQPNEEGIELRFGAYTESTAPGLHYHLPYPIETVRKVNMTQERSINLGVSDPHQLVRAPAGDGIHRIKGKVVFVGTVEGQTLQGTLFILFRVDELLAQQCLVGVDHDFDTESSARP